MNRITIEIDNLKCGGCANSIKHKISEIEGVKDVDVCTQKDTVTIDYEGNEDVLEDTFHKTLARLGYPKKGTSNAFQTAKSYVSCAIGRMTD